jgi:hypothetical protein
MFRALFAAIANGFRKLWSFAVPFLVWPFWLFAKPARQASSGIDMGAVQAIESKVATCGMEPAELTRSLSRDAQIAWSCISTTLQTRQQMGFPRALSKAMQSWLQGLDYDQLCALRNAGAAGILAHFTGKRALPNVPAGRPLAPMEIKFPPAPTQKPDIEISDFRFSST